MGCRFVHFILIKSKEKVQALPPDSIHNPAPTLNLIFIAFYYKLASDTMFKAPFVRVLFSITCSLQVDITSFQGLLLNLCLLLLVCTLVLGLVVPFGFVSLKIKLGHNM